MQYHYITCIHRYTKLQWNASMPPYSLPLLPIQPFPLLPLSQGFEVVVHGRSYFALSRYSGNWLNSTSFCDQTMPGWSHDVLGNNWACFVGEKVSPLTGPKMNEEEVSEVRWEMTCNQSILPLTLSNDVASTKENHLPSQMCQAFHLLEVEAGARLDTQNQEF